MQNITHRSKNNQYFFIRYKLKILKIITTSQVFYAKIYNLVTTQIQYLNTPQNDRKDKILPHKPHQ